MAKYQTNSKETHKPDHKQFKHPAQNRMAFQIHTSQKIHNTNPAQNSNTKLNREQKKICLEPEKIRAFSQHLWLDICIFIFHTFYALKAKKNPYLYFTRIILLIIVHITMIQATHCISWLVVVKF